jgi:alpha-pyrone synthase
MMSTSYIYGIGTANPKFLLKQEVALGFALNRTEQSKHRLLRYVYQHSKINQRYSVLPDYTNSLHSSLFPKEITARGPDTAARMSIYQREAKELAFQSIQNLGESFSPKSITHIITVSCTGFYAPGLDTEIQHAFGMAAGVNRVGINFMGCFGAITALKTADAICKADVNNEVLIVCLELCTLHYQYGDRLDDLVSNALFGDGAAAVIMGSRENKGLVSIDKGHSLLIPEGKNHMGWHIRNYGFEMILSSEVPRLIEENLKEHLNAWESHSPDCTWLVHPGGPKILDQCEKILDKELGTLIHSRSILADKGNMSSGSVLFVLKEWLEHAAVKETTACLLAFGPGLSAEGLHIKRV